MARAHTSQTPSDGNLDNGAAISLGNKLSVASDRTAYAIYFWAPTTNTGTYTVGLYEITNDDDPGPPTGTLLQSASIASGSVTPDAFNRVNITPQAIVSTKVYAAVVHSSSGRFVRTAGALNAGGITNSGITILQSGIAHLDGVIRNGMFNEGATLTYPDSVFGQPDYFVGIDDETDAAPVEVAGDRSLTADRTGTLAIDRAASGNRALSGDRIGAITVDRGLSGDRSLAAAITADVNAEMGVSAGAGVAVSISGSLQVIGSATAVPNGWYGLMDILSEMAHEVALDRSEPPVACPNDGEPLRSGPDGELYCPFDGWPNESPSGT